MTKPLLTLLAGVVGAVLVAVAIAPGWRLGNGFWFVLLTVLAGAIVMGAVARRAALRDRATALDDLDRASISATTGGDPRTDIPTDDGQEADRG